VFKDSTLDSGVSPCQNSPIVLLYGDMGLGNWIMLQPALYSLKAGFRCEICVIDFDRKTPFAYVENMAEVDRVIRLPNFRGAKFFQRIIQLASLFAKFGLLRRPVYIFGRHSYSLKNLILGAACGAKRSLVNVFQDDPRRRYYDAIGFKIRTYNSAQHECENNLALLANFNVSPIRDSPTYFPSAAGYVLPVHMSGVPLVVIQAVSSANQVWKRWPRESWSGLINRLNAAGIAVVLVGSADEQDENAEILTACDQVRVVSLAGRLTLSELGHLVSEADCVVSADSVVGHIASVFSTPAVSLLGPGGNGRQPLGSKQVVVSAKCECNSEDTISLAALRRIELCQGKCMRKIAVEQVFSRITNLTSRDIVS
jgi:ADP-heptose:LPS heptosyltransferase